MHVLIFSICSSACVVCVRACVCVKERDCVSACENACVCVCVCVRKRERERVCVCGWCVCVCGVCVCVCV